MENDRITGVEALLAATQSAHGVYEATELSGVYDEDWPRWYAAYAVEHGIGEVLGRDVTVHELTAILTRSWEELQRADPKPAESWASFTSRRVVEALSRA